MVTPAGVALAAEAVVTLLGVKAAIVVLPFETWRRMLHRDSPAGERPPDRVLAERIVYAVDRATRFLPAKLTCLPRALSVKLMLERRGQASRLSIGVARNERGKFEAHAWVEYDGAVIIGKLPDLERYTKLPPWPARSP